MYVNDLFYNDELSAFILDISGNKYYLDYENLEFFSLSIGDSIDKDTLYEIEKISDYIKGRDRAIKYSSSRLTCSYKIKDYLEKVGIFETNKIIDELIEMKLIDDEYYFKEYILQKKNFSKHSKRKISYNLSMIGFDKEFDHFLDEIYTDEEEYENALYHGKKRLKTLKNDDLNSKGKLYSSLANKGFSYDSIRKVLEELGF